MGMAFFGPALVLLTLFLFILMILTPVYSFTDYFALSPNTTHCQQRPDEPEAP